MSSRGVRSGVRAVKRGIGAAGTPGARKKAARQVAPLKAKKAAPLFNVLVIATVSAGKSSLINALIGRELLHSANEATTACVASIEHRPHQSGFRGRCLSSTGRELVRHDGVSADQIRSWNNDAQVRRIDLSGPFRSSKGLATRLVLHDTPGPNNSMDADHEKRVFDAWRKIPAQFVLYVLDIGQLTTADNKALLVKLHRRIKARSGLRIAFVLNKVDLLDRERGEDLEGYVAQARAFLEEAGFTDPMVVPTMAAAALYATMARHDEPLTRGQRARLRQALQAMEDHEQRLVSAAIVPAAVRRRVFKDLSELEPIGPAPSGDDQAFAAEDWQRLVCMSGIRTVEHLIKHQRSAYEKS